MVKSTPQFTEDLQAIQGEVESDVGSILKMAQQVRQKAQSPSVVPSSDEPEPSRPKLNRRAVGRSPQRLAEPPPGPVIQNVTTRLTQRTNELLTEAALRQRLDKATPATRQDIIEAAVREWLQKQGYAR